MTTADLLGWLGASAGITLGVPQLLRLVRSRSVEGLSLVSWRLVIALNLTWAAHGIRLGQPNMITTNSLQLLSSVPIVVLLSRAGGRRPAVAVGAGVALGMLMVGVDQAFGSATFGVVSILVAVASGAGQSIELVRAPHVRGVSTVFTLLAVANQGFWLAWGVVVGDPGTLLTSAAMGVLATFNLVWYVLRRLGLRAFFAPRVVQPEPALAA